MTTRWFTLSLALSILLTGALLVGRPLVLAEADQPDEVARSSSAAVGGEDRVILPRGGDEEDLVIVPRGGDDEDIFPAKLSETGVFRSLKTMELSKGFVNFTVNAPYWSDGAEKLRAVRVPFGKPIEFSADERWYIPKGTTFVKTFRMKKGGKEKRIETRIIRRSRIGWLYSTYLWNEDQSDGELQLDDARFPIVMGHESQVWGTPHQLDCMECHNEQAGRVLGFKLAQLNVWTGKPGPVNLEKQGSERDEASSSQKLTFRNQLLRLQAAGVLKGVPLKTETLESLDAYVSPYAESADIDDRARAYLEVNCSVCHQPNTPVSKNFQLTLDMRRERPIFETGLLRDDPKDPSGKRLIPSSPNRALFLRRVASFGRFRMPPIGTLVIDEPAVRMLVRWFRGFYR